MKLAMLDSGEELLPDPTRVILRLFLPGEEAREGHPRVADVVARLFERPPDADAASAASILERFATRTGDLKAALLDHAAAVSPHADRYDELSEDERLLLGATFSAEYAVEGAALCNPSVVPHPDQTGLKRGELRVAVSLRSIGEGHISSVGFVSAVIGPGRAWAFGPRNLPLVPGSARRGAMDAGALHRRPRAAPPPRRRTLRRRRATPRRPFHHARTWRRRSRPCRRSFSGGTTPRRTSRRCEPGLHRVLAVVPRVDASSRSA